MGASGWHYYTKWEQDISSTLEKLQNEIFRTNKYKKPWTIEEKNNKNIISIQDLLNECAEEGTHSILDITGVSELSEPNSISQFSNNNLIKYFKTNNPTKKIIEDNKMSVYRDLPILCEMNWGGFYLTVYKNEMPDEYFIIGFSGD